MGIVLESDGSDQGQVDGLFGRKMLLQGGDSCPQFRVVVGLRVVFLRQELHLAEIDNAVVPDNQHVDLCAFVIFVAAHNPRRF